MSVYASTILGLEMGDATDYAFLGRTALFYGSRVNVIHPWYLRTKILSEKVFEDVKSKGVEFALAKDAGRCLLKILVDDSVNRHSLFIAAKKWASGGFMGSGLLDTEEEHELEKGDSG